MHLYSNTLSNIAIVSSLIILEILLACFSCGNNVHVSHKSSGSDGKNIVFETPEAMIAGDLSSFIRVLSRVEFYLVLLNQKSFFLQIHTLVSYPVN